MYRTCASEIRNPEFLLSFCDAKSATESGVFSFNDQEEHNLNGQQQIDDTFTLVAHHQCVYKVSCSIVDEEYN